jgi:hypothetical protein
MNSGECVYSWSQSLIIKKKSILLQLKLFQKKKNFKMYREVKRCAGKKRERENSFKIFSYFFRFLQK